MSGFETDDAFQHLRSGIVDAHASTPPPVPSHRMRRLRALPRLREMVRETRLSVDQFVYPLFACPGSAVRKEISSMPGCAQMSIDVLVEECRAVRDLGIPAVILFGIPESKDECGSEGYSEDGIVAKALRAIREEVPDLLLWADVCLCEYTNHGHCGVLHGETVANDPTLRLLSRASVVYTEAGADVIAPSDMMDGRVAAIRHGLDNAGFTHTPICSYAAKFASAFYGPFREAAESAPAFGDRRAYQMDPANGDEALREVALDIEEGADMVMVKPALPYLDIIHRVKTTYRMPTVAYNVSGEYAMHHAAVQRGWIDHERVMMETLLSIKRAGADIIITYHAKEAAAILARR